MCGIVGLFLKDSALQPSLGALVASMLCTLGDRGPDSAGIAVYGAAQAGRLKLTVQAPHAGYDLGPALAAAEAASGHDIRIAERHTHAVLGVPEAAEAAVRAALAAAAPEVAVVGSGMRMEIYKEIGRPETVAAAFALGAMSGTHAVGHTRMATESAVTTTGAHPFSTGRDQCLVHNGSLSNHNAVRRDLVRRGLEFRTDNDSEVAAGYLSWRMAEGASLGEALKASLADLDGFYTFVVGTEDGFGVLRDPVACKPAVLAETDAWVAFGSEYRALVDLPGIEGARVWEPEPATPYFWTRA